MINNPKHPNISFKEYCQQFTKECNTTKLNKTTFVLGDLNLNKLREQQKEEFKQFIQNHISLTKQIRCNAEYDASIHMGLTSKWKRAKKEYFHQELPIMKYELDMRTIKTSQEVNFDSWRRIDQVSQKRVRGLSFDLTTRRTRRKTCSTSFRF